MYAPTTTTSARPASNGSQPHAWVASTATSAPCARAAATISSYAATAPSADCTRLNATRSVSASIASTSLAGGTVRTRTPRSACTSQGKRLEVNSTSGTTTVAPAGSAAATGASSWETVLPTATSATDTPTRPAKAARDRSVARPQPSHDVRPARQSAIASCTASHAGSGGSP